MGTVRLPFGSHIPCQTLHDIILADADLDVCKPLAQIPDAGIVGLLPFLDC